MRALLILSALLLWCDQLQAAALTFACKVVDRTIIGVRDDGDIEQFDRESDSYRAGDTLFLSLDVSQGFTVFETYLVLKLEDLFRETVLWENKFLLHKDSEKSTENSFGYDPVSKGGFLSPAFLQLNLPNKLIASWQNGAMTDTYLSMKPRRDGGALGIYEERFFSIRRWGYSLRSNITSLDCRSTTPENGQLLLRSIDRVIERHRERDATFQGIIERAQKTD